MSNKPLITKKCGLGSAGTKYTLIKTKKVLELFCISGHFQVELNILLVFWIVDTLHDTKYILQDFWYR